MSAALAAAEGLLRRLAAAAPAAWRHDPVFRWASIGAGITLALFLLRLAGPHAPELEPRTLGYTPPAGMQGLTGPRGMPSSAVQPLPAVVPKIAPGHPLSDVTVIPTPDSDRFGTFTPARKP